MTVNPPQPIKSFALALALVASWVPLVVHAAATIIIVNGDPAGVGLNDPKVVAPVGGNSGTTLGQQRLNAFQAAADIWGANLNSAVPIRILTTMKALTCTASSAVLGSAGPMSVHRDFAGAIYNETWYHPALANKLAGVDLDPANDDMLAQFNVNLGQPDCFTGIPFYLGLDNNHGNQIDLVTVLLHEFAHGLGFLTVTDGANGQTLGNYGIPSLWDHFIFGDTQVLPWASMTDSQRQSSAINTGHLSWSGATVRGTAPVVLAQLPELTITSPVSLAGSYKVGDANFGPAVTSHAVTGQLMPVVDAIGGLGLACTPFNAINSRAVNGNVALLDRGGICTFADKVKNAQNAGAIGVIIADNVSSAAPISMMGADPSITIPTLSITQADGLKFKAALRFRSRTRSGVIVNLKSSNLQFSGTDEFGNTLLHAPDPFISGSSVSHWSPGLTPNQLMEPFLNGDLSHSVGEPQDLTLPLLKDLGW